MFDFRFYKLMYQQVFEILSRFPSFLELSRVPYNTQLRKNFVRLEAE